MGRQHSGRNLWLRSLHTSFARVRVGLVWSSSKLIILWPEYEVLDGLRLSPAGLPLVSPHYCCSVSSILPASDGLLDPNPRSDDQAGICYPSQHGLAYAHDRRKRCWTPLLSLPGVCYAALTEPSFLNLISDVEQVGSIRCFR